MARKQASGKVVAGYKPSGETRARLANEELERQRREKKARKPSGPAWTLERLRESPPKTRSAFFRAVGSAIERPRLAEYMRGSRDAAATERYLRAALFDSAMLDVFASGRRDWDEYERQPYRILMQSASPAERDKLRADERRHEQRLFGHHLPEVSRTPDPVQKVHGDTVSDLLTWARRAAGGRPDQLTSPFEVHVQAKAGLFRALLREKDPRSLGGRVLVFDAPRSYTPIEAWTHLAFEVELDGQPARLNVWYPLSAGRRANAKPEDLISTRWVQSARLPVFTVYQARDAFLIEARERGELAVDIERSPTAPRANSIDDLLGHEQVCRHESARWHGNHPWVAQYLGREWDWENQAYVSDPRVGPDCAELRCPKCRRNQLAWARRHQFPAGHALALSPEDEEWYLGRLRALANLAGDDDAGSLTVASLRERDGTVETDPAAYQRGDYEV